VSVKSKEFEEIQHDNKENCGSFVLSSCDAEFKERWSKQGLEEPRSKMRGEVNYEELRSEVLEIRQMQKGKKFCTNLYKLHHHKMSSS